MASDNGDENAFDLPSDASDYVDIPTFEQILEMDEDETQEFSRQLVFGFFEQAAQTFDEMDEALEKKDVKTLSALGHFLKGSSATLGLYKIKDACEKIQHWGELKDEKGEKPLDEKTCLKNIEEIMPDMKADYGVVENWLKDFYGPDPEQD